MADESHAALVVTDELLASPRWRLPPGFALVSTKDGSQPGTRQLLVKGPFAASASSDSAPLLTAEVWSGPDGVPQKWQWVDPDGRPLGEPIAMTP